MNTRTIGAMALFFALSSAAACKSNPRGAGVVSATSSNDVLLHSFRVHCQDKHDWSDAQCRDLVKQLTAAVSPKPK